MSVRDAPTRWPVVDPVRDRSRNPFMAPVVRSDDPWWLSAACLSADPDLFSVPDGVSRRDQRERERRAKAVCSTCGVRRACLADALSRHEAHGVWGGLDAKERRALLGARDTPGAAWRVRRS